MAKFVDRKIHLSPAEYEVADFDMGGPNAKSFRVWSIDDGSGCGF
jgi:hypothetical protein